MVNEPICKIGGGTFFLDWLTWAFGSKSSQSDLLQIHLEFDPILFMAASVTPAQGKCSQRLHLASHLHWLFTFVDYFYLKFMSPLLIELWISFVSSVRSSNSHPDLLVIHQHPHFFRSHRSSTLDFHYSYIKAMMLYKGNHWTRCAGFIDTSWVRLGINNDDLGTSWALPGDNLGMTWGLLGHYFGKTSQDSGILWHTLAYSGILWHNMAYSGATWCNMVQHCAIPCIINNCWRSVPLPCGQYNGHFYIFTYIHINHLEIKTLWKAFVPCCWDHELSIEIPKVTEVRSNQARKSAIKLSNRDYLPKLSGNT